MLYKYLKVGSLSYKSILSDFEVYFSPPNKLNDPFEFRPKYTFPSKTKLKQHLIRRGAKNKNLKHLLPKAMEDISFNKKLLERTVDEISSLSGVFCVTPHRDNLLMWSHYGDSHKGICVGFDLTRPEDEEFGIGYEVEYREEYPEICLTECDMLQAAIEKGESRLEGFDNIQTKRAFTKAKVWGYENEVRFHRANSTYGPGTMDFSPHKIKEIILGAKMIEQYRDSTINLINKNFPHAKILEASISQHRYALDINEPSLSYANLEKQ